MICLYLAGGRCLTANDIRMPHLSSRADNFDKDPVGSVALGKVRGRVVLLVGGIVYDAEKTAGRCAVDEGFDLGGAAINGVGDVGVEDTRIDTGDQVFAKGQHCTPLVEGHPGPKKTRTAKRRIP